MSSKHAQAFVRSALIPLELSEHQPLSENLLQDYAFLIAPPSPVFKLPNRKEFPYLN